VTPPLDILAISGSLRRASVNTGLLRAAAELAPEDVTITLYDLSRLPFYNADLDADLPDSVRELRERILAADALLIATPEYNYSFPGILKNAIDWASRPRGNASLNNKPAAVTGAGGRFGTVRAQLQLRQVLLETQTFVMGKPELMIPQAWEKFDGNGNLTDDTTRQQVAEFIAALSAWTRRMAPEQ
jgi:chromate reductase